MIAETIMNGNNHHTVHGTLNDFAASLLKYGSNNIAMIKLNANESTLYCNDSVRNCLTRLIRCEPTTFLNPTSFARFADFAVERFMKLIHAITRIKMAIAPNN